MSKIAEKKALEAYPVVNIPDEDTLGFMEYDKNEQLRVGYQQGYDQAMQDLLKDANQYMYLSDEIGYAYACGCRKTMQDFMEKACEWLSKNARNYYSAYATSDKLIEDFKNYMQDEM